VVNFGDVPSMELGQAWWRNVAALDRDEKDDDSDDGYSLDADMAIQDFLDDLGTLGPLFRAVVTSAPAGAELSYIGTSLLERAYAIFGAQVFVLLEEYVTDPNVRQRILVGFRF
jgi:hypothetical protein